MALDTVFEKETCSRCGGSGSYSYCQSYGSTCFKCAGKGETLTKRGTAAAQVFAASLKVSLETLVVGDTIRVEEIWPAGTIKYWAKVVEIERNAKSHSYLDAATGEWRDSIGTRVTTSHAKRGQYSLHGNSETMVRRAQSIEFKQARLAEALAYQSTLTKTGAPRKRPAKTEA